GRMAGWADPAPALPRRWIAVHASAPHRPGPCVGARDGRMIASLPTRSLGGLVDETTILIVDDEPRVLDSLEAILAAEFRVLRAGHGEEALARLEAEPDVAVIVTDHRMPGMTGVELL